MNKRTIICPKSGKRPCDASADKAYTTVNAVATTVYGSALSTLPLSQSSVGTAGITRYTHITEAADEYVRPYSTPMVLLERQPTNVRRPTIISVSSKLTE
jgi:hypothetical protein